MSKRTDTDYLLHILEAGKRTIAYVSKTTYEEFLEDTKTQDAVLRNLEIIGEAGKNISSSLKDRHPEIPWKNMAGMRDKLIHHYFGVNLNIVWIVTKDELQDIIDNIRTIISDI